MDDKVTDVIASPASQPAAEQRSQIQSADATEIRDTLSDIRNFLKDDFKNILMEGIQGIAKQPNIVTSEIREESTENLEGWKETKEDGKDEEVKGAEDDYEDRKEEEESTDLEFTTHIIPEVKPCNPESFQNRYTDNDTSYAIESLVSVSLPGEDNGDRIVTIQVNGSAKHETHRSDDSGDAWIRHIRINSKAVLQLLGEVAGKSFRQPITFVRPFRLLLHFQKEMKQHLEKMEAATAEVHDQPRTLSSSADIVSTKQEEDMAKGDAKAAEKTGSKGISLQQDTSSSDWLTELYKSKEAYAELQCYVTYVAQSLMPAREISETTKIRFEDLWYLFRVGEMLYVPAPPDRLASSNFQSLRRIYRVHVPPAIEQSASAGCCSSCDEIVANRKWSVSCYHLDYDGKAYGAVVEKLVIPKFDGKREILELPFYPLRFVPNNESILKEAKKDGQTYVESIEWRFGFYAGWTLIKESLGQAILDKKGEPVRSPEHIESDVLVDFHEAFNSHPLWKPGFSLIDTERYVLSLTNSDRMHIWTDAKRGQLSRSLCTTILSDDGVEKLELNKFLESNYYLTAQSEPSLIPADEDLALLPRRLFAYAVWARKFVHINAAYIHLRKRGTDAADDEQNKHDAFSKLQIEPRNKKLIKSLVHSHFQKKAMESRGIEIGTQDLIRGKGKGVVILLHGVPGVGKTATAEAVAERWGKPLFPITCGDLGFTPESVSSELEEIFRLAHLWDCVLLLDEADVFITQREHNDLQRNALVSVFLRTLEYYNGILFLTTNRAGVLDEAVKSRVHLNLRYDNLNKDQTLEIFKINIQRLEETENQRGQDNSYIKLVIDDEDILDFASDHFNNTVAASRWNGRQIRNAFLIASSLAHYEHEGKKNSKVQKQLNRRHFTDVQEATLLYDQFRHSTLLGSDTAIAAKRKERNDAWQPTDTKLQASQQAMEHPQMSRSTFGNPQATQLAVGNPPMTQPVYSYEQNPMPPITPFPQTPQKHMPGMEVMNGGIVYPQQQSPLGPVLTNVGQGPGQPYQGRNDNTYQVGTSNPGLMQHIGDQSGYGRNQCFQ